MEEFLTDVEVYVINYILNAAYWHNLEAIRFSFSTIQECTNVYCARLNQIVDEPVDEYDYMLRVVYNIERSGILIVSPVTNGFVFGLTEQSEAVDLPNKRNKEHVQEKRRKYEKEHDHVS